MNLGRLSWRKKERKKEREKRLRLEEFPILAFFGEFSWRQLVTGGKGDYPTIIVVGWTLVACPCG